MPTMPPTFRPGGRRAEQQRARSYDAQRGTAAQRGYDGAWQKARRAYLAKHPLCVKCEEAGEIVAATVVDHIIPHRGDRTLFWDSGNWQALCKPHHDRDKQREERRGPPPGGV